MKSLIAGLVALAASAAYAGEVKPWQEQAVGLARAEPKVVDAWWSQDISFWVSVADDGSNRDGFASYLCLILMDAGKPGGEFVSVTIWDAASTSSDSPQQLGKAHCQ